MLRKRRKTWTPRPRSHPGRKALAYHESGHAVIGYLLGLEIEQVTINPHKSSLGRCRFRDWEELEAAGDLSTALLLIVAGAVAEEIAMGTLSRGADDERACGLALARGVREDEAVRRVAEARLTAASLLNRHWAEVKQFCTVLRKQREMDGSRATAILTRAFRRSGILPIPHHQARLEA